MKTTKYFMFEAIWKKVDDCESVIRQLWESTSAENACVNLLKKLIILSGSFAM